MIALLKRGADTTLADNHSVTPLHQAAAVGNREIMGLLAGSCPAEVSDDQGVTPLMSAISYKKVEAAKFLISRARIRKRRITPVTAPPIMPRPTA